LFACCYIYYDMDSPSYSDLILHLYSLIFLGILNFYEATFSWCAQRARLAFLLCIYVSQWKAFWLSKKSYRIFYWKYERYFLLTTTVPGYSSYFHQQWNSLRVEKFRCKIPFIGELCRHYIDFLWVSRSLIKSTFSQFLMVHW